MDAIPAIGRKDVNLRVYQKAAGRSGLSHSRRVDQRLLTLSLTPDERHHLGYIQDAGVPLNRVFEEAIEIAYQRYVISKSIWER